MKRLVLAVVSTALWTSVALASPPQDIADLAGARAAGGETQMFSRGYAPARTKGLTAYWWNDATSTCARVITGNGRYKTLDTAKASDCGKAAAGKATSTTGAAGNAPQDIADLAGARAAGGETQLYSRGYAPARTKGLTAYWWNDATSTCARVVTGNGRYKTVDTAKASDCGKAASGKAAATTGAAAGVPQAARNACAQRADQFQNATPGSSSVDAAAKAGQNWVLKMATGEYRSTCTVTATGKVVSIDPG